MMSVLHRDSISGPAQPANTEANLTGVSTTKKPGPAPHSSMWTPPLPPGLLGLVFETTWLGPRQDARSSTATTGATCCTVSAGRPHPALHLEVGVSPRPMNLVISKAMSAVGGHRPHPGADLRP